MNRACVIGWPVEHSLSPIIHRFWLRTHGLSGEYVKAPVAPQDFPEYLSTLSQRGFSGANITIPHKIEAHRLCEARDAAADAIGAVNTVWLDKGRLSGSNTDAWGFIANLDDMASGWDDGTRRALVIGAGGAARAVVWALLQRGFTDIRIVNRTEDRAADLSLAFSPAKAFGFDAFEIAAKGATLIVNTSSLGMVGSPPLLVDLTNVAPGATVCDIVYRPLETELLRQARASGLRAVDGLGMLLHQAAPGFEKWFGVKPAVTEDLRAAVLAAIYAHDEKHST